MSRQAAFSRALLAPKVPVPDGIRAPRAPSAEARFGIYRNSVTVSLIDALRQAFPVIETLVGARFFAAMAREFLRAHPPQSPVLAFYGADFPDWLRSFPPVAALLYLPEVAMLEQALRFSCHAADAAPLAGGDLARLSPDRLARLRPRPHPSARVIVTRHPALSIWARNSDLPALAQAPAGEVLICRPAMEVCAQPAPRGTDATLKALARGEPLAHALPTQADHAAIFACLFSAGALIAPEGDHP